MRRLRFRAVVEVADLAVQNYDGTEETDASTAAHDVIMGSHHLIETLKITSAHFEDDISDLGVTHPPPRESTNPAYREPALDPTAELAAWMVTVLRHRIDAHDVDGQQILRMLTGWAQDLDAEYWINQTRVQMANERAALASEVRCQDGLISTLRARIAELEAVVSGLRQECDAVGLPLTAPGLVRHWQGNAAVTGSLRGRIAVERMVNRLNDLIDRGEELGGLGSLRLTEELREVIALGDYNAIVVETSGDPMVEGICQVPGCGHLISDHRPDSSCLICEPDHG